MLVGFQPLLLGAFAFLQSAGSQPFIHALATWPVESFCLSGVEWNGWGVHTFNSSAVHPLYSKLGLNSVMCELCPQRRGWAGMCKYIQLAPCTKWHHVAWSAKEPPPFQRVVFDMWVSLPHLSPLPKDFPSPLVGNKTGPLDFFECSFM